MGKVQANWSSFLSSLAQELNCQASRVRDLIGDSHWLTDGHHKEFLLTALLNRHLPSGILASRGFVISSSDRTVKSTEQDILLVDTQQEAPLFNQGGVVICLPESVVAAVSVKTTMGASEVHSAVTGLNSVRNVLTDHVEPRSVWCGAYFFCESSAVSKNGSLVYGYIQSAVAGAPIKEPLSTTDHPLPIAPDILCSATNLMFQVEHGYNGSSPADAAARIVGFTCDGLATASFLANLLGHVAIRRGAENTGIADFTAGFRLTALPEHSRWLKPKD